VNPENLTVRELAEMLEGAMMFEMLRQNHAAGTRMGGNTENGVVSGAAAWEVFRDMFRVSPEQKRRGCP